MMTDSRLLALLGVAGLGWLLYLLAPILTPFVASALLAYVCDPLVDRLEGLKLPRTPSVLLVFVFLFGAIWVLMLLVAPLIETQITALAERLPAYIAWIEERILPRVMAQIQDSSGEPLSLSVLLSKYGSYAGNWGTRILASITASGSAVASALVSLVLIPVLTFYLLRDWDRIIARGGTLVPLRHKETIFALAAETDSTLGAFLRGQLLVMLALAVIYTGGLLIVGVPHAIGIGVVAGLVSFVPYLGFVIGILLAGLTALVESGDLWVLGGVAVVFGVAQFIEGNFLTPRLVGDRIGLHPVMVIFAIMAGGQLFGFFGILVALPVAAVISVLARFFVGRHEQSAEQTAPTESPTV